MKRILNKRGFLRDDDGVALVEFAIFLPLFLLSFFVIVEFSRVFFSFQGAITGVRDATRYLARVSDGTVCQEEGTAFGEIEIVATNGDDTGSLISAVSVVREIIIRNMESEIEGELPLKVELLDGTGVGETPDDATLATFACVEGIDGAFRQARVPIARVEATFRIKLPLSGILELNGQPLIEDIKHTLSDESRIYGM